MSDSSITYDPEVRRILEGIQRARGMPLLRIPRGNVGELLRTTRLEPAEWRTDPVALEVELVAAYREQVAHVLYEASKVAMYRAPVEEFRVYRTPTIEEPVLVQRAGRLREGVGERLDPDSHDQLTRVMSRELDAVSLAIGSHKLVPRQDSHFTVVSALISQGRDREARALLQTGLNGACSDEDCATLTDFNMGFLEYREGNYSAARWNYKRVGRRGGVLGREGATAWFSSSALTGDQEGVLGASAALDGWIDEPKVAAFLCMLRAARAELQRADRRRAANTLRPLSGRLSEIGARIANVFFEG